MDLKSDITRLNNSTTSQDMMPQQELAALTLKESKNVSTVTI